MAAMTETDGVMRRLAKRARLGPTVRAAKRVLSREHAETWAERRARQDETAMRLLLSFVLEPNNSCIDVGAGLGDVMELIVAYAPDGHHIAFEPIPHQFEIVAQRFPSVDVRDSAASDRPGKTTFTYAHNFPAYSGFRPRDYPGEPGIETITVRTERIDDVVAGAGRAPALIKIDVEGAEGLVLAGARETIRAHRPIVVFEHGHSAREYGTTSEEIFDVLCGDGRLRVFDLDGGGPYSRSDFAASKYWNFVAHR
jgi:FkbM family methyltransferase